jgi:hypothetical protein
MGWLEFLKNVDNRAISHCLEEISKAERKALLFAFPTENEDDMCYEEAKFNEKKQQYMRDKERTISEDSIEYNVVWDTHKDHLSKLRQKFGVSKSETMFYKLKAEFTIREGNRDIENLWGQLCNCAELTTSKMGVSIIKTEQKNERNNNGYRGGQIFSDIGEDSYHDRIYIYDKFKINISLNAQGSLILLQKDSKNHIDNFIPSEIHNDIIHSPERGISIFPEGDRAGIGSDTSGRNEIWAAVIPETTFNRQEKEELFSSLIHLFGCSRTEEALQSIFNYIEKQRKNGFELEILRTVYSVL